MVLVLQMVLQDPGSLADPQILGDPADLLDQLLLHHLVDPGLPEALADLWHP